MKKYLVFILGLLVILGIPEISFALGSPNGIPILDKALNGLSSYLTGKFATGLGVLTVAGAGYGTLVMGKLSKSHAVSIVIGLGLVFGSGQVLSMLGYGNS